MAATKLDVERIKREAVFEAKKEMLLSIEQTAGAVDAIWIKELEKSHIQLQTLRTHLPAFCSNKDRGCQEILMKEEMISHEKECVYRPINCPDLKCTAKVTYHGLLDHFTEVHKDYISMDALKKKKFLITCKIGVNLKPTELLLPTRITDSGFYVFILCLFFQVTDFVLEDNVVSVVQEFLDRGNWHDKSLVGFGDVIVVLA